MPLLAFIVVTLFKATAEGVRVCIRKVRETKVATLCKDCVHTHVQYSAKAELAISCTYAGRLRPLKMDVLYCTDYRSTRLSAHTRTIGFVHEIVSAE